ncbi:AMP-binding protein [Kitasatospora sp. NPDC002227]|uniref:class I adenylate-forming enzyme family protein n=1 Tax=Kitasatospora sp. NPDC002227 TaxID=3154773 RepID=UPI003323057F
MLRRENVKPISARLAELAAGTPDRPAVVELTAGGEFREISYRDLVRAVSELAEVFRAWAGDGAGVICLPATVSAASAKIILAALCAGVTIFPHTPGLEGETLAEALGRAGIDPRSRPASVPGVREPGSDTEVAVRLARWSARSDGSRPRYLLATSGSTGVPKLVPFHNLGEYDARTVPDLVFRACGWRAGQRQLLTLPVHHIGTVAALVQGVLDRNQLYLAHRLDSQELLGAIEEHRIEWLMLTPNYLRSLLPLAERSPGSLSSLRGLLHTALPCPAPLKHAWVALLGGDRLFEMYGGTEGVGVTVISGTEWLARPGSVGRGLLTEIRIDDGPEQGEGGVGRIYLRRLGGAARARQVAHWLPSTPDGFVSLGDLGWLDEDGYLYVFDRAANRAVTATGVAWLGRLSLVLRAHPGIQDAECILLGDAEGEAGVLLVPRDATAGLDLAEVRSFCAAQLGSREFPQVCLQVGEIPRSEIGKPDAVAIKAVFDSAREAS